MMKIRLDKQKMKFYKSEKKTHLLKLTKVMPERLTPEQVGKNIYDVSKISVKEVKKRAKERFKKYPDWVINTFTNQELKGGFMMGKDFYRPTYSFSIGEYESDTIADYQTISNFLFETIENNDVGQKFNTPISGYVVIAKGDIEQWKK